MLAIELTVTYLTNAGLNARDKHMKNWTSPFVAPSDEELGTLFFTKIMLTLQTWVKRCQEARLTYENARQAIRDRESTMASPIHSGAETYEPVVPVDGSIPLTAMLLRKGKTTNANGQSSTKKLYNLALSNMLNRDGRKRIWISTDMRPEMESE